MSRQIRVIGFCNSLYIGQVKQSKSQPNQPQRVGILFNDMAVTCLSKWHASEIDSSIRPEGNSVLLLPNRQIFYSQKYPINNVFEGFWCCMFPQLKIFGNGDREQIAVLHSSGNVITEVTFKRNQFIFGHQKKYGSEEQKWEIINLEQRSLKSFIKCNFSDVVNSNGGQNFKSFEMGKDEHFYGILNTNQCIGFVIKQFGGQILIKNSGYYNNFQLQNEITLGRKYYDNSKINKICQGYFKSNNHGCIYQFNLNCQRPNQSNKIFRNYFRQSTNYCNKYVHLHQANQIQRRLAKLKDWYMEKVAARYSQQIIQGNQQTNGFSGDNQQNAKTGQIVANTDNNHTQNQPKPFIRKQYKLQEAKAIIQKQIKSKYKQRNPPPIPQYQLKSPLKKPKKYEYSDIEHESQNQYYKSLKTMIPLTNRKKINEFNLYSTLEREKQNMMLLQRQIQKQLEIQQSIQFQNAEIQRIKIMALERQRDLLTKELQGKTYREIPKENQFETEKKLHPQKPSKPDKKQYVHEAPTMRQSHSPQIPRTSKRTPYQPPSNTKRKPIQYKYTQSQKQFETIHPYNQNHRMSTPYLSRQNTPLYQLIKQKYQPFKRTSISKSPISANSGTIISNKNNKNNVNRRIFSYVD